MTRIDTHAAAVFLAGERALKIKRAVRFPFLDYSTLEKRKAACEAEIAINRTFAPQIYRRVVAITREPNGGLAIGGNGEPVEWAVEMRAFRRNADARSSGRARRDRRKPCRRARPRGGQGACGGAGRRRISISPRELAEIIAQNDAELRAAPELFRAGGGCRADAAQASARSTRPPAARRARARRTACGAATAICISAISC